MVVGLVTLLIVGPKDIPKVIRTVRDGMKQVRGLAREFQSGMDELVREADLDDARKLLKETSSGSIQQTIRDTVDPKGELQQDLDIERHLADDDKTSGQNTKPQMTSALSSLKGGEVTPVTEKPEITKAEKPAKVEAKKVAGKTKTAKSSKPKAETKSKPKAASKTTKSAKKSSAEKSKS